MIRASANVPAGLLHLPLHHHLCLNVTTSQYHNMHAFICLLHIICNGQCASRVSSPAAAPPPLLERPPALLPLLPCAELGATAPLQYVYSLLVMLVCAWKLSFALVDAMPSALCSLTGGGDTPAAPFDAAAVPLTADCNISIVHE
jgi:hypothetical protein